MPTKTHHIILAKILDWAHDNEIEITIGTAKCVGLADKIELTLKKNGRTRYIRFFEFGDVEKANIQTIIMNQALELCLTRLVL